jgi:hypothetical protein
VSPHSRPRDADLRRSRFGFAPAAVVAAEVEPFHIRVDDKIGDMLSIVAMHVEVIDTGFSIRCTGGYHADIRE